MRSVRVLLELFEGHTYSVRAQVAVVVIEHSMKPCRSCWLVGRAAIPEVICPSTMKYWLASFSYTAGLFSSDGLKIEAERIRRRPPGLAKNRVRSVEIDHPAP